MQAANHEEKDRGGRTAHEMKPSMVGPASENCDARDTTCATSGPGCITLGEGVENPLLQVSSGICGSASPAGPYEVIRGQVDSLAFSRGSVDLGPVACVAKVLVWDRVTDLSPVPHVNCNAKACTYFLARESGAPDFGEASTGELRNLMDRDPPCP